MQTKEVIRELPKGLIKWYEFHKNTNTLYVAGGTESDDPLQEALEESGLNVHVVSIQYLDEAARGQEWNQNIVYDYIIMVGALERSHNPVVALCFLKKKLSAQGRLLIGTDNRLGIRYFCGDRDIFTERNFDSIENYVRANVTDGKQLAGHSYARAELQHMLKKAGFLQYRFYSVLPQLERPQVIFAEDYLPEEELEVRIIPQYHCPDTVFLEEERLYTTLIQNGLFHTMANGYLIECSLDGNFENVRQITVSMERGVAHAMCTVIRRDNKVEKKAIYDEGKRKIKCLLANNLYLQNHGVKMVDAHIENGAYVMPYIQGEPLTNYFREILCSNKQLFLRELDRYWELICNSSEQVPYEDIKWEQFAPNWRRRKADDPNKDKWKKVAFGSLQEQKNLGIILKYGYIDLVSLNCFYLDGEFVFYDQELYVENLPAKVILYRTICFIYRGNTMLEHKLPIKQLMERYCLGEYQDLWNQFTRRFLDDLRNDTILSSYYKTYRRDIGVIHSNRQRINYSADEYERLFRDIFRGTEGKKIYLFGSGNFADKFLSQFGADYEIAGILDNNSERWGTKKMEIPIFSPEHVNSLSAGTYKVIVCIKNYVPVVRQLKELGVRDYGIYDSNLTYPRKQRIINQQSDKNQMKKKYHIGYIAGVFDLFHVGHLNMFKRAKEQCDYLIVGVVDDAGVMRNKKTMPCIPFTERIELVRSCRYVDEAVEIPENYSDTDEAYRRYQFDVQFSGSDYVNDPKWQAKKTFLQKHGSDLVFFPYTKATSSTKIKTLIEKKFI